MSDEEQEKRNKKAEDSYKAARGEAEKKLLRDVEKLEKEENEDK